MEISFCRIVVISSDKPAQNCCRFELSMVDEANLDGDDDDD
eukprot:CAMPEP_0119557890 /NCGR_PEP_ID=MMETSP1352-20130426/9592_1 /TAXON_ID=265584 /ORGANISM="Stauroneis constricta, Strain CCMP1120" /LENGTH=40 /DNA_ID= /DNA_START= /DNA_END= /DNA_ORIENTATION=